MKIYPIIFFILLSLTCFNLFSAEVNIVDVHRNIPMSDDEIVYKDFYINAGENEGLKKNLVVNVKRKITVKDAAAKTVGDFETTVGQLRLIHVDAKLAVAREYKLLSRDTEPMIEQIGLMIGDRIDLAGSFVDSSKPVYKKKIAEIDEQNDQASARLPAESNETPPMVTPEVVSPLIRSTLPPKLATPEI